MTISIFKKSNITSLKVVYSDQDKQDIDSIDEIALVHTDNVHIDPEALKTAVLDAIKSIKD